MSESIRLFVGIFPSEIMQKRLNRKAKNWSKSLKTKVRLLPPESLHLTLKFIGNINKSKLDEFTKAFLKQKASLSFALLEIQQLSLFPSPRKPRVLAAEVAQSPELQAMYRVFNSCFADLGIVAEDRSFKPHITLARSRRWQKETVTAVPLQLVEPITEVALMRSQLSREGAKYSVVASIPLC